MKEEYQKLETKEKYLLNVLSIFGNEKTKVTSIFDLFFENDEFDELHDILFDLKKSEWIEFDQDSYILTKSAEEFIFNNEQPNTKNSAPIIEFFKSKLIAPFSRKLDKEFEVLLLKMFSRIIGNSKELALLYDYYGQYLSHFENNKTAQKFYTLAIEMYTKLEIVDVHLCNFYNHLADSFLRLGDYSGSLNAAFKSSHIAYTLHPKDLVVLVYSYTLISNIYFKQKKYKLAYEYNLKLLDIAEKELDDNNLFSHLYLEASFSAFKNKLINESVSFLDKSLKYALKVPLKNQDHQLIEKIKMQRQYMNLVKKLDISFVKLASWKLVIILLVFIVLCFVIALLFL